MKIILRPNGGFALVITLVTLLLLTIMAVAYLASSSLERATARALANRTKAELAAKAAVNNAIARLTESLSAYPDSATTWESVNASGGGVQFQGTTLYYREQTPEATAAGTPSPLHALPLISGAQAVLIPSTPQTPAEREANLRAALPVLDSLNSFDLNHARSATDNQGRIGAPPGATARPEFRGQWIEQENSDGKVTSRYAYWVEDESFKANVNVMGNTPRGGNTLGDSPSQIPLQGLLGIAVPGSDVDADATSIVTERARFPGSRFFEYRAVNQVGGPDTLAESAKFLATIYSGATNLSRSGAKRVNLNQVITPSVSAAEIRTQLDQIIKTITVQVPNFSQRFYRTGSNRNSLDVSDTGSPSHRTIYLNKIAANIRDYIDTDSQPTIVNNDAGLTIRIGPPPPSATWTTPPTHAIASLGGGTAGPSEVIAIGKERSPVLQEYMLRVKQTVFSRRNPPPASYTVEIDHYVEFWNMTNTDIPLSALGPSPFLRIANQFRWDANAAAGGTDIPEGAPRDFSIPLSFFETAGGDPLVFRAGAATVLTTDQSPLPTVFDNVDAARIFRPRAADSPNAFRVFSGITQLTNSNNYCRLNSLMRPNISVTGTDAETEIILGNDYGTIESFAAVKISSGISVNIDSASDDRMNTGKWHFRGSSLKGNALAPTSSQTGDPRTNNEQLSYSTTSGSDSTPYLDENQSSTNPKGDTTFTQLNTPYVNSSIWADPSSNAPADAARAPAIIANQAIATVGELGNVFDPSRQNGGAGIAYSRGGGRTLKIGQADRYDAATNPSGLWDGNSNSASREWTAWRLTDLFSTNDLLQLPGQININGINRDGGGALRAALYGYLFQAAPNSDPNLSTEALDDAAIDSLIEQLKARIRNDSSDYTQFADTSGPLFERGEVSEMPIFNSIATGTKTYHLVAGVDTSTAYDRGREELFRRISELTTTRGSVFTVYAVGQSVVPQAGAAPPVVASTSRSKLTFRIDPVWTTGIPADPFDPTASTTVRFRKPDKYAIKTLSTSD